MSELQKNEPPGTSTSGLSRRSMLGYASAAAFVGLVAADARPHRATANAFTVQALGPAVGWDGHKNGQVPLSAMTTILYPNSTPFSYRESLQYIYMRPDAANDLVAWLTAYHGRFGRYLKLNEGYRTLAGQQYWFDQAQAGGDEAAPVGRSNHGLGQAIDFERSNIPEGSAQLQWLRDTASTYGFARYANERWHFDYTRPWTGNAPTPTPEYLPQEEDEDMYARRSNGEVAIFGASYRSVKAGGTGRHIFASPDEYNAWRSLVISHNTTVDASSKRPVPPELSKVMNVDDLGWGVLNAIYGT